MISSALILSVLMPMQISQAEPRFGAFAVKAVIDAAVIAGLPPSKAARKEALVKQVSDPLSTESFQATAVVSARRLFFRQYFNF
jgi:hypothetical protein